jgi:hypothetical protein
MTDLGKKAKRRTYDDSKRKDIDVFQVSPSDEEENGDAIVSVSGGAYLGSDDECVIAATRRGRACSSASACSSSSDDHDAALVGFVESRPDGDLIDEGKTKVSCSEASRAAAGLMDWYDGVADEGRWARLSYRFRSTRLQICL